VHDTQVTEVTRPDVRVQAMSEARALGSVPAGSQVCPVVDYLQDATHFYLVMPYLEGGDLFERVSASASAGLPAPEARRYFRQVLSGLLDLKRRGIAHGWVGSL
jgi:serine/threonine protein kinase